MRKNRKIVTVDAEGVVDHHINAGWGEYPTLCGLDAGLTDNTQEIIPTPRGAKVTCEQCFAIWREAKKWNIRDFDPGLKAD